MGISLLLLILLFGLEFLLASAKRELAQTPKLQVISQVPPFTLTNENAEAVSQSNLLGRVWIADVIFTRCPGPCLKMTHQMKELQESIPPAANLRFVTLTSDPDYDTPPILQKYAARFDADTNRWMFLTGLKSEVRNFSFNGLKLSAVEVEPSKRTSENDLFIHSTRFVIVDKKCRLRGVFNTDGEITEWPAEKKKILAAANQLEREP